MVDNLDAFGDFGDGQMTQEEPRGAQDMLNFGEDTQPGTNMEEMMAMPGLVPQGNTEDLFSGAAPVQSNAFGMPYQQ